MGTSSAYGGPGNGTPLVPTWLDSDDEETPSLPANQPASDDAKDDIEPGPPKTTPPSPPPIETPPKYPRFSDARGNLTRFASSGGRNRASLGRAVSGYVSTASGGARQAALRMGTSRIVGARLLGFLSDVRAQGVRVALHALNLEWLAGQSIQDIFLGLADYVCPAGGTVDEGIARDAFIETIVDLEENGITNLDELTADQMQTVFELYATHTIEARILNDIGAKIISVPSDMQAAAQVQAQLRDFIRRGVSDALTVAQSTLNKLTPEHVQTFVDDIYEQAFAILQVMGDMEAD